MGSNNQHALSLAALKANDKFCKTFDVTGNKAGSNKTRRGGGPRMHLGTEQRLK